MPILILTAADWLDDKARRFELGADDYSQNRSNSESSCSGSERSTAGAPRLAARSRSPRRRADDYYGLGMNPVTVEEPMKWPPGTSNSITPVHSTSLPFSGTALPLASGAASTVKRMLPSVSTA
jgi:hypothetical protein